MPMRLCRKGKVKVTLDQSHSVLYRFWFVHVLELSVHEIFPKSYLTSNFWLKFIYCGVQIDINASFASHNVKFLGEKKLQR